MVMQKKKKKRVNSELNHNKKNVVRFIDFNDIRSDENRAEIEGILKKITAMLHFANRTRKVSIGLNNSLYLNSDIIGIVMMSDALGESSKQKLISHCSVNTPIYLFNEESNFPNDLFYTGNKSSNNDIKEQNDKRIKIISVHKSEFSKKINKDIIRIEGI